MFIVYIGLQNIIHRTDDIKNKSIANVCVFPVLYSYLYIHAILYVSMMDAMFGHYSPTFQNNEQQPYTPTSYKQHMTCTYVLSY